MAAASSGLSLDEALHSQLTLDGAERDEDAESSSAPRYERELLSALLTGVRASNGLDEDEHGYLTAAFPEWSARMKDGAARIARLIEAFADKAGSGGSGSVGDQLMPV